MFFQRALLVACAVVCSVALLAQAAPAVEIKDDGEEVPGMYIICAY